MGAVYSLAVLKHKDVEMLASGSDRDIILWAAKGWKKLKTLQGPIILAPPLFFYLFVYTAGNLIICARGCSGGVLRLQPGQAAGYVVLAFMLTCSCSTMLNMC